MSSTDVSLESTPPPKARRRKVVQNQPSPKSGLKSRGWMDILCVLKGKPIKRPHRRNKSSKELAEEEMPTINDCETEASTSGQAPSIKRSHLLAALSILKSELEGKVERDPLFDKLRSKYMVHRYRRGCSSVSPQSKARMLTQALVNSVFRHDWTTAAHCLHTIVGVGSCLPHIYRVLLLILFHHPHSSPELIDNFLRQVLNLRTRSNQVNFLQQMFFLPDDIEAYTSRDVLSAQAESMDDSDDEAENMDDSDDEAENMDDTDDSD